MKKLKDLRIKNNFTQAYIAKKLNMTRQGYANYENGITQPPPDMLVKISKIYDCSIDYLLNNNHIQAKHNILTEDAEEIITQFNALSEDNKNLFKIFLKVLSNKTKN
ncbi:MAG: helix-turn-helix transcriptional regulator [Clostridia bacterium]|nr:helix-turn-helix transcriptional regulator [Clostridia bacterium]